jgi:cytochrome c biogenesis protein CcmG/thiol:disulfide interchange protein DsbE
MRNVVKYLIPLAIFLVLAGFLAVGLHLDPRNVPSPLIGKPAPRSRCPSSASLAPSSLPPT